MLKRTYYLIKPLIPRRIQIILRRKIVSRKLESSRKIWPIDYRSAEIPTGWKGWPDDKKFAVILTHDVDTVKGQERCTNILETEKELGFKSSFNFVPERYKVDPKIRNKIVENGFEVGVHGLNHDGKLYNSKKIFEKRAKSINRYLKEWGSVGFRSPAMHHNLEWIHELNILYDSSTFDTDPFEPQSDGVSTIFPFWIENKKKSSIYLEMPYTLVQDFTLFILMCAKDTSIWNMKTKWIADNNGMVLLNVHPDYMKFKEGKAGIDEYDSSLYMDYLLYLRNNFNSEFWNPLPKELAHYMHKEMPPVFKF